MNVMRKIQNNIFETICSKENLILAWRRVESSFHHGDVWYDELELAAYKFNLVKNIEDLSKSLSNGTYKMKPIKPAPYPKNKKIVKDKEEHNILRVRQSFCINVEDQIVWMAVYGVLGPYFEEQMPAWSYGNRMFLNTWKNENGKWINGVYRTTSKLFYRKWTQGWPLYRHMLSACIKRMAFPGENDEDVCDDSVLETIEENDAQVNDAFKLPYLEKDYFPKDGIHPHLYYLSIDLEKFYQTVSMDKIRNKLLSAFSVDNPMLTALINSITKFEVVNEGNGRIPFTDEELKEMDLPSDLAFDGLPTGLIVAGALANLYILDVDLKVCEKLKNEHPHHILHFRYVDDHLFISEDAEKLEDWKNWYILEIRKYGLKVNESKTDKQPIKIDSTYPTPLITQTLQKLSEISKMPLDLLNSTEFGLVFRDLQMLLVSDFPEQEIKKGTRTSFACTMLSRLPSDINVDYDKIRQKRKEWLEYISKICLNEEANRSSLRSLIFSTCDNYPERLDESVRKLIEKEGVDRYNSIRNAIGESRKEIKKIEDKIFNLLVYSVKEISDKPKMWLRILDFCIYHAPKNIQNLYIVLNKIYEDGEMHSLGYEYIVSVMNTHIALQALRTVSRHAAKRYKDPWKKIIDELFLEQYSQIDDKYNGIRHYLYEDADFLVQRTRTALEKYMCGKSENSFLDSCRYNGLNLDSSFWLLWHIDKLNRDKPNPDLFIPNFLAEELNKANIDSKFFVQLLFTCVPNVSLSLFGENDFKKIKFTRVQKESLLLAAWDQTFGNKIVDSFGLKEEKISCSSNKPSLIQWIKEVRLMEKTGVNTLSNALCSEYCATLIMSNVVSYFCDKIENIKNKPLHPASILMKRKECLDVTDWDSWLSPNKKISIYTKKSFSDVLYRYPSYTSNEYEPEIGAIYGLGIIFLQLLTKEYTLPWVFNRPEYGYEWQSVLYRLLEKGKVSSTNFNIIAACLSLENRETIKLKGIFNNVVVSNQLVNDAKIESLEDLLKEINKSLDELKENQISVANHETRQLVMIKI